jgi:hypothetical protein
MAHSHLEHMQQETFILNYDNTSCRIGIYHTYFTETCDAAVLFHVTEDFTTIGIKNPRDRAGVHGCSVKQVEYNKIINRK